MLFLSFLQYPSFTSKFQRPTWSQGLHRCWYVKPINTEKTNRNNNGGSVGKSYSHVHEGYGRVTPGQCSLNCSRRDRVQAKVQCLKTGPIQLREHTPTKKACRSRGIKVAAPPLDSPCDGPVTYSGDTKILVKSSKGRSGPTLNTTDFLKYANIRFKGNASSASRDVARARTWWSWWSRFAIIPTHREDVQ